MDNFYLDVCHSQALADVRVAYHEERQRSNITKKQVAAVTVVEVKGEPDAPKAKTHVAAVEDDLWIVTAEDP